MSERKAYQLADGTFVRTQAEAKGSGQKWELVHIPVDSQGLVDYLNTLVARNSSSPTASDEAPESPPQVDAPEAQPLAPAPPTPASAITGLAVEEWILDHAKPYEVENLFSRLGTRFHEMHKLVRVDEAQAADAASPDGRVDNGQSQEEATA